MKSYDYDTKKWASCIVQLLRIWPQSQNTRNGKEEEWQGSADGCDNARPLVKDGDGDEKSLQTLLVSVGINAFAVHEQHYQCDEENKIGLQTEPNNGVDRVPPSNKVDYSPHQNHTTGQRRS